MCDVAPTRYGVSNLMGCREDLFCVSLQMVARRIVQARSQFCNCIAGFGTPDTFQQDRRRVFDLNLDAAKKPSGAKCPGAKAGQRYALPVTRFGYKNSATIKACALPIPPDAEQARKGARLKRPVLNTVQK